MVVELDSGAVEGGCWVDIFVRNNHWRAERQQYLQREGAIKTEISGSISGTNGHFAGRVRQHYAGAETETCIQDLEIASHIPNSLLETTCR